MKKTKKILLSLLLCAITFFAPNVLAEEAASINNIDIQFGSNPTSAYTKVSFTLNDDFIKDFSYIEMYDGTTPYTNIIDFHDFKVVSNTNPTTKEEYEAGSSIDSLSLIPKGSTLFYYGEREHFKSENIIISANWKNASEKYYQENIEYTVASDGNQSIKKANLIDKTDQINTINAFYAEIAKKYTNISPIMGDEDFMIFGYKLSEDTFAEIGGIEFKQKSLNELLTEFDSLVKNNTGKVNIPESETITSNILSSIKNQKLITNFEKKNEDGKLLYSWSFNGNNITDADTKLNINLQIETGNTPNKEKIDTLVPASIKSLKLNFKHTGVLPTGTTVKLNVTNQFNNDDILDLYYYNSEKGIIEKTAENIVVIDGYVNFPLAHASEYVLVVNNEAKKVDNNVQTSSMNVILYTIISIASASALAYIIKNKSKEIA